MTLNIKMFIFGVTVVLYFIKILSGSRNFTTLKHCMFLMRQYVNGYETICKTYYHSNSNILF